jgi:two-component system, cell cycle sensor histidine kinase and response regulator CckA
MAKTRVLVVEDETIVAMDIAELLRRLGYEVAGTAASGEDAIALAAARNPDLILMDVHLKGAMDGIEAAAIIGKRMSVPIVFVTAHGDSATVSRSMESSPYGYLVKPFDDRVLHRVVEVALTRHRSDLAQQEQADQALWESEERFRLLVDAVADYSIVLLDRDGNIVSWNAGSKRLTGYSAEEVTGRLGNILLAPEARDDERYRRDLAMVVQTRRQESEGWRIRKDGSRFWGQTIRTPVFDRNQTLRGFALITRDVSERQALEAQLLQAQKLEGLGKLAGGIAHDFNNMLMVIFARVELLKRIIGAVEPQRRYLADISAAATKSRDLTQQLLAFARRQVFHPQLTDLNEVVASTMTLLTPALGEDVVSRVERQENLWPVYADPGKLHQVLLNLTVNAREAMPNGGLLTVETRNFRADPAYLRQHPQLQERDYVTLVVSDNGIGIPPAIRDQIYDPFFSTKETGTGLGLAVVRGIVEQMGGQIWVYSEVGQGTTFRIFLPRYRDEAAAPVTAAAPEPEVTNGGNETILLTEDEQLVRTIIRETLEEHGYRVLEARTPAEALAVSAEYKDEIHLLLTDIVMPGGNGRRLADELCAQRPTMRVIYMSGYTDDIMVRRGVVEQSVIFLEKPATTNALLQAVRKALE